MKQTLKRISITLSFVIFGIICMIGNIIFVPIIIFGLQQNLRVRNFARDLVRLAWGGFLAIIRIYGDVSVSWRADIRALGQGTLIIANHPSLLDVVILLSHIRHANCVVKESLCKNPFLFGAIKAAGYIPNTGSEDILKACENALNSGESLIIFPEGTRTKERIDMHKAAFYVAINYAQTLHALAIKMEPKSLKKGQMWYDTPDVTMKYEVYTIANVRITDFAPEHANPIRVREIYEKMKNLYDKENL